MTSIKQALINQSIAIAADLMSRKLSLEKEKAKYEIVLQGITSELEKLSAVNERVKQFPPKIKTTVDPLCPNCWIQQGRESALMPVNAREEDPAHDVFKCKTCDLEFSTGD